ncbi:MAG: hypothetical protein Fur0022_41720 [Anaerolineales bacterium]
MKFLANENFPVQSVQILRRAGIDISAIVEDSRSAKDSDILSRAHTESRIVLTFDRDYGELIYRLKHPKPDRVVYLRFDPQTPGEPAEFLLHLIQTEGLQLSGKFTVANRDRIRQRSL